MYNITSEQIIGSYAVKYSTLTKLINSEYANSNSDEINLFIDLTDILKGIGSQIVGATTPYSIAASIVNLCAHYRNFFKEYYKTHTRFFLILSDINNYSINLKSFPLYRRKLYSNNPKKDSIIQSGLKLVEMLCPYIEDIYYKYTNYEFGVYVYDIIQHEAKNGSSTPGLILSKDPYTYQMVSDDAFMVKILRPKKDSGEDTSYIINFVNAIEMSCTARKLDIGNTFSEIKLINPSLLSLIYALTRVPERGIPSLHKLPNTIAAITQLIWDKLIINDRTTDIEYICNLLTTKKLLNIKDIPTVRARFNAIDIETQFIAYSYSAEEKYNGIVNLYDPKAVKEISMQYFKDNPLDLNVL